MNDYTIWDFLKATLAVMLLFTLSSILLGIYVILTGRSTVAAIIFMLLGGLGGAVIIVFWLSIRPSVISIRKVYQNFISGKTNSLNIESPAKVFLREEEIMLNRINELTKRETLARASNAQSEYLVLQNQINLHFLYNALEAIRGDALTSGMKSLADVVLALSAFFRYTISGMQTLVSVDEELENINNYFLVQKYRFGENLQLKINFLDDEKEIRNLQIPKLTLQPIVENSVYHGVEGQVNRGEIAITFDQTETHLFISIKDTGRGIPEDELKKLNDDLNEMPFRSISKYAMDRQRNNTNGHVGIALKNISRRIKLFFGDEYGINIFSTVGIGTTVKLIMPRQYTLNDLGQREVENEERDI